MEVCPTIFRIEVTHPDYAGEARDINIDDRCHVNDVQANFKLSRISEVADIDGLSEAYALAKRYEERLKKMAVAEALACGLPVISTPTGAISELVQGVVASSTPTVDDCQHAAGILVPVGDIQALAHALADVIDDAALRARLADGARRARLRLPTWDQSCRKFAEAIKSRV